jgi:hypothetical protein
VAASRRQGLGLEHHGRAVDASGKGSGCGSHRCGDATVGWSNGARRRPCRREGWLRLRLAPGAAGEDKRGQGGSKSENDGEWVGGSVADVDERWLAWPCAEESEGEKRRGDRGGVGRLLEAEAARQGRGSGGVWTPRGGQKRGGERGPWAHFMNLIVHFMNVIVLPDFIQLLYNKRKHSKKMNIFLSIFNLLQFIYCKNRN